jgi:manganese efflux pump family protein
MSPLAGTPVRVMTRTGPSSRLRGCAAKMAMAGAVLAGVAAGCSSQSAVTQGSESSCFQYALGAIQRHVTVTAVPDACQGLSQIEVSVAVDRALHAAAAGVRGKVAQHELIARYSPYVADLIHAVSASSQPAVAAPRSYLPSRAALSWAALAAWLVTVGLGISMMARWITRTRRHGTPRSHGPTGPTGSTASAGPRGWGSARNFTHFGLALFGLLVWISYLATGVTGLAWAACGLLLAVASLGMTLLFLPTGAADAPGDDPPPGRHLPVPVIAAHIAMACVTILLATLAAIGSG